MLLNKVYNYLIIFSYNSDKDILNFLDYLYKLDVEMQIIPFSFLTKYACEISIIFVTFSCDNFLLIFIFLILFPSLIISKPLIIFEFFLSFVNSKI